MSDVSLVPVDHQPDFEDVSLVPVDHDPFSADGVTQQAQSQQAQTPLAQPQSPATTVGQPNVGAPANNTQASEPALSTASTLLPNNAPFKPFGELKPATFTPTQWIGNLAADGLTALGMPPYTANDLAKRIGNLLGLSPLGVVGSTLDLIDANHRGDLPGALLAAAGMIPPGKGVARGVAEEAGAGLRALTDAVRRSPASRAAEKGFSGIGTTPNGGPTFAGTDHLYSAGQGQRSIVEIPLTGGRRADDKLANKRGGFTQTPSGYRWHHVDDFNPKNGTSSLELVREGAHKATYPHAGSVSQYEKFHGIRYKR
jgi:hypothetical protein